MFVFLFSFLTNHKSVMLHSSETFSFSLPLSFSGYHKSVTVTLENPVISAIKSKIHTQPTPIYPRFTSSFIIWHFFPPLTSGRGKKVKVICCFGIDLLNHDFCCKPTKETPLTLIPFPLGGSILFPFNPLVGRDKSKEQASTGCVPKMDLPVTRLRQCATSYAMASPAFLWSDAIKKKARLIEVYASTCQVSSLYDGKHFVLHLLSKQSPSAGRCMSQPSLVFRLD